MSRPRQAKNGKNLKAHALEVDTRDETRVKQMIEETTSAFGRIDYFVSTAGVGFCQPVPQEPMANERGSYVVWRFWE